MELSEKYAELPRFDLDEAMRRCMGKKDFLEELSIIFVNESLVMYLPGLEKGLLEKDFTLLAKNAHGIKGGCGAIGLIRARDMAYDLEMAGKAEDFELSEKIYPILMEEIEAVKQLIDKGIAG